jgi:hypothetical protein
MDAVPGRLNQVQFYSIFLGTNWGQCSELCGINHAFMPIELCAFEKPDFLHFLLSQLKLKVVPIWNRTLSAERKLYADIFDVLAINNNNIEDKLVESTEKTMVFMDYMLDMDTLKLITFFAEESRKGLMGINYDLSNLEKKCLIDIKS